MFPSVQTVSHVFDSKAWYCQVSTGLILKWWTWRRRLWGAGCLPCCSCEDRSGPGWPPPLWTSGSEPFYGPWKPQRSSEAVRGGLKKLGNVLNQCQWAHVGLVYILEKLEGFYGASSVGEKQPQVFLRHILPVKIKDTDYTLGLVTGRLLDKHKAEYKKTKQKTLG